MPVRAGSLVVVPVVMWAMLLNIKFVVVWVLLNVDFRGCSVVVSVMPVSTTGNKTVAHVIVPVTASGDDGEECGEEDKLKHFQRCFS